MTKRSSTSSSEILELMAQSDTGLFALVAAGKDMVASSEELLEASKLVGEDDVRVDMIRHLHPEFDKISAREAGLRVILGRTYDRKLVTEEMLAITRMNRCLTQKIREKMEGLE